MGGLDGVGWEGGGGVGEEDETIYQFVLKLPTQS